MYEVRWKKKQNVDRIWKKTFFVIATTATAAAPHNTYTYKHTIFIPSRRAHTFISWFSTYEFVSHTRACIRASANTHIRSENIWEEHLRRSHQFGFSSALNHRKKPMNLSRTFFVHFYFVHAAALLICVYVYSVDFFSYYFKRCHYHFDRFKQVVSCTDFPLRIILNLWMRFSWIAVTAFQLSQDHSIHSFSELDS